MPIFHPQQLALLQSILANPDDDLPRLVYADWLEENGTTDAAAARVEFIRLGCKSKAKSRITPAETRWLDANWPRLLGTTTSARPTGAKQPAMVREGQLVRVKCLWWVNGTIWVSAVTFEFVRGFARRVEYLQGHSYKRFWQAAAMDEPLAYHRPESLPQGQWGPSIQDGYAKIWPESWGVDVFSRALGFDELTASGDKRYLHWPQGKSNGKLGTLALHESVAGFHPLAVADEVGLDPGDHRQRAAVATAMTAIAREYVGLTSSSPAG